MVTLLKNKGKKFGVIIPLLILIVVAGYFVLGKIFIPQPVDSDVEPIDIKIKPGLSMSAIADTLDKNELIKNASDFILACKLFGKADQLKAGFYKINPGSSVYQIMNIIVSGKTAHIRVVIPEGLTSYQIASILEQKVDLDSVKFIELVRDPELISQFNVKSNSLEGYLFPDTYHLHWSISEREAIKILLTEFNQNFSDSLKNAVREKGWSVHQILTLASIIEGEAVIDSERAIIAAVYHNRLKRGMLLQADPTIQYIILDPPRRLLNKDLEIDSPYNTYRYPGLPPGPVNNPGLASIIAAIYPADVDYLYFVARGDGSHNFSKTLSQHLKAKAEFDKYRRMIKRQERKNDK